MPLAQRIGFLPATGWAPVAPIRIRGGGEGMLQPLGISAEAEAVYVALGPSEYDAAAACGGPST